MLVLIFYCFQIRINNLGYLDMAGVDCNTPGSSQLVANTLDELAGIIEDVGMANLCKQLGVDAEDCRADFP